MWILSSLGRPDRIRDTVASYVWGVESTVLLTLYSGDPRLPEYLAQQWPENWRTEIVDMLGNGPTYNEVLRRYPDEPCYGFLADDVLLEVPGMLWMLEEAAGRWNVAYANDQHHEERICTMPCIGGELVRTVGYLAPVNMVHKAIDCVWHEIGRRLGALRFFQNLKYTHLHPLFGTAKLDYTYLAAERASAFYEQAFRGWMMGGELDRLVDRVEEQRKAA